MGTPDYMQNMCAYTAWADGIVLNAAARLNEEQLRSEAGGSRGSLLDNLAHVAGAQLNWLEAWRGDERGPRPEPPVTGATAWLRDRFARSHADLEAFAAMLDDASVEREIELTGGGLRRKRWPLWMLMTHVALHSTQHRAETAVELTRLGEQPGRP